MFVCVMIFDLQELMKLSAMLFLLLVCIIPETLCFSIGLRHQSVHDDGFSETKVWDDDSIGFSFMETCPSIGDEFAIRLPYHGMHFCSTCKGYVIKLFHETFSV
jgi:hypothetical protein